MPLAFETLSHGTIAFGFFQIESHMLLLDRLFFFADDFCAAVTILIDSGRADLPGWRIDTREAIGDLHGAIAGRVHSGFIGQTYLRWPFPARPEDFKQNPDGHRTRDEVAAMIAPFGTALQIPCTGVPGADPIRIGDYAFSPAQFSTLLAYVDRGGHPRWRDEHRPDYVAAMKNALLDRAADGSNRG